MGLEAKPTKSERNDLLVRKTLKGTGKRHFDNFKMRRMVEKALLFQTFLEGSAANFGMGFLFRGGYIRRHWARVFARILATPKIPRHYVVNIPKISKSSVEFSAPISRNLLKFRVSFRGKFSKILNFLPKFLMGPKIG